MKLLTQPEEMAKAEWHQRHPFDVWPLNSAAGAAAEKKKEALELIEAARHGRSFSSVQWFNISSDKYEHYAQPATPTAKPGLRQGNGPIDLGGRSYQERESERIRHEREQRAGSMDWNTWRNSLPDADPNLREDAALAIADLAAKSPNISDLLSKVQDLPTPTRKKTSGNEVSGGGGLGALLEWEKVKPGADLGGELTAMYKQYGLVSLPPRVQLANLINYRNGLVREGANPKLIKSLSAEIGRLAQAYKRHWED